MVKLRVVFTMLTDNPREAESELYRELEHLSNNPLVQGYEIKYAVPTDEQIEQEDHDQRGTSPSYVTLCEEATRRKS